LPHYVLPLYPAIAILIAGVVNSQILARERWAVRATGWWLVFPVIFGIGAVFILVVIGRQFGLLAWIFVAAAMIFGLWAWRLYPTDGAERSLLRAIVAAILLGFAIFGAVIPALQPAFPSVALAGIVRDADCGKPEVAAAGYQEPSLVFLVGTDIKLTSDFAAADFLRGGACRYALIESKFERSFLRRAEAIGLRYAPPLRVDGFNYSVGRRISIGVYRSEVGP
jgi:4-amino-4-deoxy-L-arabinose transferase-like glycosyltransferase